MRSIWMTVVFGVGMIAYTLGLRYWDIVAHDHEGIVLMIVGFTLLTIAHFSGSTTK